MASGRFQGDDLDIFLSEEEIIEIGSLQVQGNKLVYPSLEVMLDTEETTVKAIIAKQEFDELGDGIKVEKKEYGFFIRINENAYWRIRDSQCFGTRYDGENKVHFRRQL